MMKITVVDSKIGMKIRQYEIVNKIIVITQGRSFSVRACMTYIFVC